MTTEGFTPEPWPQVDEEQYKRASATTLTTTSTTIPGVGFEPDSSVAATYDFKSEPSGLSSDVKTTGTRSREASFHSQKPQKQNAKSYLEEDTSESPAPPPPSPENKETTGKEQQKSRIPSQPSIQIDLDELIDSESGYTLTAKPPSNLDDISRIQTPAYSYRSIMTPSTPGMMPGKRQSSTVLQTQAEESKDPETSKPHPDTNNENLDTPGANGNPERQQQEPELHESQNNPIGVFTDEPDENHLNKGSAVDQFDVTEAELKQELQEEYQKLSSEQNSWVKMLNMLTMACFRHSSCTYLECIWWIDI